MQFFYQNGTSWVGPYSARELKQLAFEGIINPTTLIMSPDKVPPTPAHKAKGLFLPQQSANKVLPAPAGKSVEIDAPAQAASGLFQSAIAAIGKVIPSLPARKTQESLPVVADSTPSPAPALPKDIGQVILHAKGGTKFQGTIHKEINPFIPDGLYPGEWTIILHKKGVRFNQNTFWGENEHEIHFNEIKSIQPFWNTEIQNSKVASQAIGAAIGFAVGGFLGAAVGAGVGSIGSGQQKKYYLQFEIDSNPFLVETQHENGKQFLKRVSELS